MDSIVDPNGMALLANITKKGPEQKLGLLKKSDGTYYKMNPFVHHVPFYVLRYMMYKWVHFVVRVTWRTLLLLRKMFPWPLILLVALKLQEKITKKPYVLKQFIKNKVALKRLTTLYRAVLALGYTPNSWAEAKVIFIPKPGKKDFSLARSWRPISLLSCLLKTVERLCLWEMEAKALKETPLSHNQHAFRMGFSTETALSSYFSASFRCKSTFCGHLFRFNQ